MTRNISVYEIPVTANRAACDNCLADLEGKATRIELVGLTVDLCSKCMIALRDEMAGT